jgi:hypothetical protein
MSAPVFSAGTLDALLKDKRNQEIKTPKGEADHEKDNRNNGGGGSGSSFDGNFQLC